MPSTARQTDVPAHTFLEELIHHGLLMATGVPASTDAAANSKTPSSGSIA